jgi:hypothetical protein
MLEAHLVIGGPGLRHMDLRSDQAHNLSALGADQKLLRTFALTGALSRWTRSQRISRMTRTEPPFQPVISLTFGQGFTLPQ